MQGLTDAIAGKDSVMTPDETRQVMMEFQKSMMEKRQAAQKAEGDKKGGEKACGGEKGCGGAKK